MVNNICFVCKKPFREHQLISALGIGNEIVELINEKYPGWDDQSKICKNDFNIFRMKYITQLVEEEKGNIENLEREVIKSINENEILTIDTSLKTDSLTFGDRISDKVASFGGSWKFIIAFFSVLILWILGNSFYLYLKPFDPYPFILLNLILSCVAAIQAPIIMMSQNRQEVKDRIRAENDYKVNLKSEIEIRTLHEKVDHLLLDQWSKMMKIQAIQIEILNEIRSKIK
ncbi:MULTISPECIES: DUF1003 domain-containing protein [Leptospira]|uniref:DUF1003 domain-containing protein n=1 Tax=Leptospira TaxID=171 RepID=UPI001090DA40|nr:MULTISPECIES: DUF1003 domain-containing protein [Leptospira]MCG6151192.1 DUF1003 domain-containing protein [Leptospira bandrabouensis]TGL22974.1 DUF1003 domain-containing protein [Leptospira bourretii]